MKRVSQKISTSVAVVMVLSILLTAGTVEAKNKKYGIFVGINDYPAPIHHLYGAVNDAENMREMLITKFKFPRANTTLLIDDRATRDAILGQITAYGKLVGAGDELVFQYSGHGSLWPDKFSEIVDETVKTEVSYTDENGVEQGEPLDYYDSAIVPWDAGLVDSGKNWGGLILDDELYALFSGLTKKGVTVVFMADSCHSGTIGKEQSTNARIKFTMPEKLTNKKDVNIFRFEKPVNQIKAGPTAPNPYYIAISAAKDNEFALDDFIDNAPAGLFTATLIKTISGSKTPLSYRRLIALLQPQVSRASAIHNNNQHPQLDSRFGIADTSLFEPVIRSR